MITLWLWLIHVGIRPHCVRGGGGRPVLQLSEPWPRTVSVSCQSIYPLVPLPCSVTVNQCPRQFTLS